MCQHTLQNPGKILLTLTGSICVMTWWLNESLSSTKKNLPAINQKNVVLQTGPDRCGYASLQYLANYHGRNISEIGSDNPGPLSMEEMIQLAEAFGLKARGVFCPLTDLPTLECPCIVLLHGNHFVVLESISQVGFAILMDPAVGRRRITWEKFFTEWEGLTLLVTDPDSETKPDENQGPVCARFDRVMSEITE